MSCLGRKVLRPSAKQLELERIAKNNFESQKNNNNKRKQNERKQNERKQNERKQKLLNELDIVYGRNRFLLHSTIEHHVNIIKPKATLHRSASFKLPKWYGIEKY